MRAAIYARYSTELQSDKSIDDQVALCRRFAKQNGHKVVEVYSDAAKSGAFMVNREGIQRLMHDARDKKFDVVISESVDRLGRNTADVAGMYNRLNFLGLKVVTVNGGHMNALLIAVMSGMAQAVREDTADKVRRGMEGLVREKRSAGGKAYGYRANPEKKGEFIIVPEQAAIVREIFERYVAGQSPRKIAYDLNNRHVPPPRRDGNWNASTINGYADRGSGILHNQLYVGRYVWNKNKMVKDPDGRGTRLSRPNEADQRMVVEMPELRIIPGELFDAAQRSKSTLGEREGRRAASVRSACFQVCSNAQPAGQA